jgi:hypothetical protein
VEELRPLVADAPRLVPDVALPRVRFVPDLHPHPRRDPAGSLHGEDEPEPGLPAARWREDRSYLLGVDLYHQGYLWESHEAWEACYFAADDATHRDLLQSLIQLAAAELQLHRGVAAGVRTLAGRVALRLGRVVEAVGTDARLCGLAVAALHRAVLRRFRGALAAGGDPLETGGPPVRLHLEGFAGGAR